MPIKTNEREYRNMAIEARANENQDDESRIVTGYASTFNEPYCLYRGHGWQLWEVVDPGAFDDTDMDDVIMQYDHEGRVFARTRNNTLRVNPDNKGLFIEADLGGTELGRGLYDEIAGGYTDRMSFGFTITGETWERTETEEGVEIETRHITAVGKLYDVSAVSIPANDATSISVRELTDGVIERLQAERLEAKRLEVVRKLTEIKAKRSL